MSELFTSHYDFALINTYHYSVLKKLFREPTHCTDIPALITVFVFAV